MLGFLRRKEEETGDLAEMMTQTEYVSVILQHKLNSGELRWTDEEIQFFIPVVLNFTDFTWLDLIAKNNCKDYEVIRDFLDHVKALMRANSEGFAKKVE